MRALLWLLTASMMFVASPVSAQVLWQNLSYGMSADEVRRAQPEARANPSPGNLANGARCELRIERYQVQRADFEACFFMLDGRLHQVTLQAIGPNESLYRSISELLRARYGQPLNDEGCRSGLLRLCQQSWLNRDTGVNISLVFMSVGGRDPLLNIVYQRRVAQESERL